NLESQKLQYAMQDRLHHLGWQEIEIVDEDLGRTASGTVTRAGFERMVAEVLCSALNLFAVEPTSCQQIHYVVTSRLGRRYVGNPPRNVDVTSPPIACIVLILKAELFLRTTADVVSWDHAAADHFRRRIDDRRITARDPAFRGIAI